MIDTIRTAVLPKGMAQDVVVGDSTVASTIARASVLVPPTGGTGTYRPAPHGPLATRPWVGDAKVGDAELGPSCC